MEKSRWAKYSQLLKLGYGNLGVHYYFSFNVNFIFFSGIKKLKGNNM